MFTSKPILHLDSNVPTLKFINPLKVPKTIRIETI